MQLTYRGGPVIGLRILVQRLHDEGLEVEYEPPMEYRGVDLADAAVAVAMWATYKVAEPMVAGQLQAAVRRAVVKFRATAEKAPPERRPTVEWDEGDGY
jgi:hypothetical protein